MEQKLDSIVGRSADKLLPDNSDVDTKLAEFRKELLEFRTKEYDSKAAVAQFRCELLDLSGALAHVKRCPSCLGDVKTEASHSNNERELTLGSGQASVPDDHLNQEIASVQRGLRTEVGERIEAHECLERWCAEVLTDIERMVVSRTQVVQDEANGSLSRFKQQIKHETEALSLAVEDINAALQIRPRECRVGTSDSVGKEDRARVDGWVKEEMQQLSTANSELREALEQEGRSRVAANQALIQNLQNSIREAVQAEIDVRSKEQLKQSEIMQQVASELGRDDSRGTSWRTVDESPHPREFALKNRMQRFANVEKLTLADESLSSAPLRYPTDESREEEVRYLVERLANALPNNESVLSSLLQAAQDVSHRPLGSTPVPTRQQGRTHSTPTQSTAQLHEFARDYSRGSGSTKRFGNRESSPSTSPSKSSTTQKKTSSRPNSMVLPVTTGRSPLGSLPQTHTPPGATPAYSPSLSGKVPSSSPDMMGHGKVPSSSPDIMMHGGMRLNRRGKDSLW